MDDVEWVARWVARFQVSSKRCTHSNDFPEMRRSSSSIRPRHSSNCQSFEPVARSAHLLVSTIVFKALDLANAPQTTERSKGDGSTTPVARGEAGLRQYAVGCDYYLDPGTI